MLFDESDREAILATSVCPTGGNDKLIWHYIPMGNFLVASAYSLGAQLKFLEKGIPSFSTRTSLWSLIWEPVFRLRCNISYGD